MIIYFGADHGGFELKEKLKDFLRGRGYEVADVGNVRYEEDDDYPDFAAEVARRVSVDVENSRGIVICKSGVGVSIVANKFPKIRAGLVMTPDQAFDARSDDDINMLALGAQYLDDVTAQKIVTTWLGTPFRREPRFLRRIDKIDIVEKEAADATMREETGRF